MNGWTLTLISKNCKYPERAIAFMDYMMSEHGQMLIYLGVEGVTYDIVDGKPVLKEDVSKILNSDRETYDRLYGADDAYWMLQNNVMQLQWEQKAGPATEQLLVWACKYTVYNGQYDVSLSTSPEIAAMDEKCTKLWSETLPKLLLASNEAQFDEIFEEFVGKRNAMGYQEVLKQKTVLMNAAKEKWELANEKIRELFRNTKLNIKFTSIIILFMVIPIGVLAGVLFYVMEQNAVQENMDYMEYTMQRNEDGIKTKIDSINMSTQFFLSDDSLLQMLNASAIGGEISTADWLDFKNNEVSALERLVNNNPLLYGVRVYAVNDSVQEMMPILYNASRMKKQEWSKQDKYVGWNFDYTDNIFNSYTMNQNRKIISLVTPIIDSANGKVGVIESAMTMENMFPSLYEGIEDEWSFFYSDEGVTYFGQKEQTESSALLDDILKQRPTEDKIQTIYKKLDGKNLVISYMQVRELSGTLICVKDITKNVHNVYFMRDVFVAVMLAFIILLAFFINRIVQHLLKQFYEILKSIRKVQKGDLDVVIENCGKDEMGELGTQINKMLERIKELMEDNLNREMLAKILRSGLCRIRSMHILFIMC